MCIFLTLFYHTLTIERQRDFGRLTRRQNIRNNKNEPKICLQQKPHFKSIYREIVFFLHHLESASEKQKKNSKRKTTEIMKWCCRERMNEQQQQQKKTRNEE